MADAITGGNDMGLCAVCLANIPEKNAGILVEIWKRFFLTLWWKGIFNTWRAVVVTLARLLHVSKVGQGKEKGETKQATLISNFHAHGSKNTLWPIRLARSHRWRHNPSFLRFEDQSHTEGLKDRVSYASVPQHRRDRNLLRKCTINLIPHQNHNGEVVDRSWLCFSPSQTCVKCFTCRLMCADMTKCTHFHIRKGIFDWKHALELLRSHEHSMEHIICRCHDHPYLNIFCIHTWGPSPRLGPRSPTIWLQCCLTLKCTIDQFSHS